MQTSGLAEPLQGTVGRTAERGYVGKYQVELEMGLM